MNIKYGLLTILRTPLKTFTFFLLIAAVTVFLSLGFGMWQSAQNMLDEADTTFTTAGEFVYASGGESDSLYYDEELAGITETFNLDDYNRKEVILIEENITQRAYIDGYKPSSKDMPLKNFAVLAVKIRHYNEDIGGYGAIVLNDVYSSYSLQDNYIFTLCEYDNPLLEEGRSYVVFGTLIDLLGNNSKGFEVLSFSDLPLGDYADYPSVTDITDYKIQDFFETETGKLYEEAGSLLKMLNDSVDVTATKDINIVENFHNGKYALIDGKFFDNSDANVCIVPKRIASQMELSVGDTISLSFHYPTEQTGRFFSYQFDTGFAAENLEYTIAGIYQADEITSPVFIPNAGQEWLGHSRNDDVLARVSVDNRRANDYLKAVKSTLPDGIKFDLYDQGYKAAVMSINGLRDTAVMITVLCLILCVLVLWMFGLLFIHRNERSAKTLLMLGAGKLRVMTYYLSGSGAISALASALGAITGYFISKNMFGAVYESIEANSVYDFRFSVIGYGVRNETFSVKPEINPGTYIFLASAVILASLLFSFFFAASVIRKQNPHYRFRVRKKAGHISKPVQHNHAVGSNFTMLLPTVALRYSIKSVLRGGKRSFIVPLLFTAMLFFTSIFYYINAGFQERLNTVYEDVPVTMRFSDISGKKLDGLVVTSIQTDAVEASGYTEQFWASYNNRFMVAGVSEYADGTHPENPPEAFALHPSVYVRETLIDQWHIVSDENIFLNAGNGIAAFERAPEFAYSTTPEILWAEGYGESDFISSDTDKRQIVVSDSFLRKHNVSPGDTISVVYMISAEQFIAGYDYSYQQTELVIAGHFVGAASYPTVYIYSAESEGSGMYQGDGQGNFTLLYNIYNSAGFLLKETDRLSEFKDLLEEHFDPLGKAGRNRIWAIVDDTALYDTVDTLTRYISYMNVLYPIILALVAGIGFLVSHLLLKGRAGEIATLRGIGSPKVTVFFSYFNEQFLLSLAGIAIGLTIATLALGGLSAISPTNVLLLCVCYYAGLALAIVQTYRKAAIQAITAKEE